MMLFLQDDWILLFGETKNIIIMNKLPSHIMCDDRIIIDKILFLSFTIFLALYKSIHSIDSLSN